MSISLSTVAQELFDAEVKHAFQTAGKLRDTVMIRNGVVGDTYNFRAMAKGLANQKASQDDVTPMNVVHSTVSCTLGNWNAPEYSDIFDQAEVNFDERMELATTIAGALGRRLDQLIIDAMGASAFGTQVGTGTSGLAYTDLIDASRYLNDNGVPGGDRHVALTAKGLADLLEDSQVTSQDYVSVRALMSGDIDTWMGFKFHIIESRNEGGLAVDGNDQVSAFCWHKSAVGLAIGMDIRTEVNYVPTKTSWLCNGVMKAGAVTRDIAGVIDLLYDEVAA